MSRPVEDIAAEMLSLPSQTRAYLAEKLIESLDVEAESELSPAWRDEIGRRCQEIDDGLVELRDADDVFATAYASLRGRGDRRDAPAP